MWQREQNVRLFVAACRARGIAVSFVPVDLEDGTNARGITDTLKDVAKRLDKDGKVSGLASTNKARLDGLLRAYASRAASNSKIYANGYDILKSGGGSKCASTCYYGNATDQFMVEDSGGQAARDYYCEYIALEEDSPKRTRLENNIAGWMSLKNVCVS